MIRVFLDPERPLLQTAGDRLLDAYTVDGVADLAGAAVVLPGGRAGRRLKEILVEGAAGRGLRLVPPLITTIGALPELFYDPERPLADPVVARRAWSEALQGMDEAALETVFPARPEPDDLRGWESLAGEVEKLHHEVSGAGHQFSEVAHTCAAGTHFFDDQARWNALAEAQTSYLAILEETDRADRDAARIEALRSSRLACDHELWLVGVVEMPAITRRMIGRAGTGARILVHAAEAEASGFDDLGCLRPAVWGEWEIEIPDEVLRIAERPSAQADHVAAELAALGDGFAAEEIAIAVPHEEVVPYLEERLEGYGIPTRTAAGTPLPRTPTYRLLEAISEQLRSGARWDAFAALLRHPEIGRWLGQMGGPGHPRVEVEETIREADRFHAERLPLRAPMPPKRPDEPGDRKAEAEDARKDPLRWAQRRLVNILQPLHDSGRLAGWPARILAVLSGIYGDRALSRDRPAERRLLDTLGAFRRAALAFARLPERLDLDCDAATAIDLLLEAVRNEAVPDDPDRTSVELLGWLEMPLDDAPVAFVTGFNEPFLPQSITADPFLPDRLRSALGMLDNRMRYARDAYHLKTLLRDRAAVRIISGRATAEGDPLHPSRLMLAIQGEALARRIQRFSAGDPPARPVERAGRAPGDASRFALPPEPVIVREPPDEISVTAFAAILDDPYLWALRSEYRLRAQADDAREMDGMVFGALAHDVLQAFGRDAAVRSTDEAEIRSRLGDLLEAQARLRFGTGRPLPAVRLQIRHLGLRLDAFARWQAAWAAEGWEVRFVEGLPLGGEPGGDVDTHGNRCVPFDVDGTEIRLKGRIDRIDYHPVRDEWALFDYKTTDRGDPPERTHRKGREKAWVDLQLPLYRHLAAGLVDAARRRVPAYTDERVRVGYILLPRDLACVGSAFADWSADELAEAEETAREVVRRLREGRFEFEGAIPRYDDRLIALLGGRQLVAADDEDEEEGGGE